MVERSRAEKRARVPFNEYILVVTLCQFFSIKPTTPLSPVDPLPPCGSRWKIREFDLVSTLLS